MNKRQKRTSPVIVPAVPVSGYKLDNPSTHARYVMRLWHRLCERGFVHLAFKFAILQSASREATSEDN